MNEFSDLSIRRLSPAFRRDYWTRNGDEPDAVVLWPGLRQEIGRWLADESPIVIAALAVRGETIVASRSVFSRSQILPDLWYYGYFYTLPNFRRLGLGECVMREGLAEIARAGGRYCSCYVADDNQASANLALKLGFRRLPFVRLVIHGANEAIQTIHHHQAETWDVRMLDGAISLIDRVIGGEEGTAVIMDELLVRRPWQPWKAAESQLVRLEHEMGDIGIARIGPHKAVLLPDPSALSYDPVGMLLSVVAAMSDGNRQRPIFSFIPDSMAEVFRRNRRDVSCEIYDVFWNDLG